MNIERTTTQSLQMEIFANFQRFSCDLASFLGVPFKSRKVEIAK